jgi:hypothetical protein
VFWVRHPDAWEGSGYARDQLLPSVFNNTNPFHHDTLLDALRYFGNGPNAHKMRLMREAVAALLNDAQLSNYPLDRQLIINDTNEALQSPGQFDDMVLTTVLHFLNVRFRCPLENDVD